MKRRTVALHLARGAFAAHPESRETVYGALGRMGQAYRDHRALRMILGHPNVDAEARGRVLLRIAGSSDAAVEALVQLVVEEDAFRLLPEIAEAYRKLLMESLGRSEAEVVTAVALLPEQMEALRQHLGRFSGTEVTVYPQVDPAILGGVVVRMGGRVLDGSLRRHLERLGDRMRRGTTVEMGGAG